MVVANEERLVEIIARAVAASIAAGAQTAGGQGNGGPGQRIAAKAFSGVRKLEKGKDENGDWSNNCKVTLASVKPPMNRTIEIIETLTEGVDTPGMVDMGPESAELIGLIQRSAKLFQVFILKAEGEAKLLLVFAGGMTVCGRNISSATILTLQGWIHQCSVVETLRRTEKRLHGVPQAPCGHIQGGDNKRLHTALKNNKGSAGKASMGDGHFGRACDALEQSA